MCMVKCLSLLFYANYLNWIKLQKLDSTSLVEIENTVKPVKTTCLKQNTALPENGKVSSSKQKEYIFTTDDVPVKMETRTK